MMRILFFKCAYKKRIKAELEQRAEEDQRQQKETSSTREKKSLEQVVN